MDMINNKTMYILQQLCQGILLLKYILSQEKEKEREICLLLNHPKAKDIFNNLRNRVLFLLVKLLTNTIR